MRVHERSMGGIMTLLAAGGTLFFCSCGPKSSGGHSGWGDAAVLSDGTSANPCQGHSGQLVCDGNSMITCNEKGDEVARQDCATMRCVQGSGCVLCAPGQVHCQGNLVMKCGDDMMHWEEGETCDPDQGQVCDEDSAGCMDLCQKAAETKANVGCEYLAVDMANVDEFQANDGCFVVIVSNVQITGNATVTVEDAQGNVLDFPGHGTERSIAPGELAVFAITGASGQCDETPAVANAAGMTSGVEPGTVFMVKSTLPVVAYQINPYQAANKHTTDASLLIPTAALGDQYMVATYFGLNRNGMTYPSSISIVAVQDNTTVTVSPTAGMTAGGDVPASGTFNVTLNAHEHLQIMSSGYEDLTASVVTATAPVAVFSGDVCSDVPMGMGYCDHLEEQIPAIQSWGWTYVAAFPPRRKTEKTVWRIIAAIDGTQLFFEPSTVHDQVVLNGGEMLEFETDRSFLVQSASTQPDAQDQPPILVVNYLNGAEKTAQESGTSIDALGNQRGDPAMTLSVPVEQYLNSYVFLSDPSYAYNYVIVVRTDPNQIIHLDCLDPIPEAKFTPVAGDYGRAKVVLSAEDGSQDGTCSSGAHRIHSDRAFGIWVYGYFADTSYGYPGGMNLEQINDVVVVE